MKGINHFIIHLPKDYNDTFTTQSGLELYADRRLSAALLSVRVATVVSTPFAHETVIQPGYEVMIDDTITRRQIYKGVEQESIFLVDRDKKYYKLEPGMVILYRENADCEWQAYGDKVMVEFIEEQAEEVKSSLLVLEVAKKKTVKGRAKVLYPSAALLEYGVQAGDEIAIAPDAGIPYYVGGKTWQLIHDRHVLGVILKEAV